MEKANKDIREAIAKKRLYRYEVANALGISDSYMSVLLRHELPAARKEQILDVINKIVV